ncbi:MAG TPA: RNA polymerase sigma-70 factor [Bacteroidales bacterium]|nr:RNA polymerase sigma-70 factor [Bacteroidales bacterium]
MMTDSEIAGRIRKGDKVAFESLFRSSYVSLVKYARTLLKDQDTSEEIVQDLFVRLWQERESVRIESSFNGYLFRAVHNRCLHYIEHRKVVQRHADQKISGQTDNSEDPAEILHYKDLQKQVAAILERLPERCGKIFCMSRFEGLKYSEIAEKLSVSIKTVEASMGRALREFRKELTE